MDGRSIGMARQINILAMIYMILGILVSRKGFVNSSYIVTVTDSDIDYDSNEEDEADSNDSVFGTMWPIMMTMVCGGVFIAIIVTACKRLHHKGACCKRRRTNADDSSADNSQNDAAGRRAIHPPDGRLGDDDYIWSIDTSALTDDRSPGFVHFKPPPYCENPPAYDEIQLSEFSPKLVTDNSSQNALDISHVSSMNMLYNQSLPTQGPSTSELTPVSSAPPPYSESTSVSVDTLDISTNEVQGQTEGQENNESDEENNHRIDPTDVEIN